MMEGDKKCSILMVDDQPENLLALEALLSDLGHRLVRANSGREALKHLLAEEFALILLDVRMPDMDGFETASLLRQRPNCRHTPIIFLTAAYNSDSQMFKGYSVGAVDYILKPFAPEILKTKVSVFIDLHLVSARAQRQMDELQAANKTMQNEVAERRRAEEAVRRLSEDLELRVLERTAQIIVANEELQKEVQERKRAEERVTASLREKETLLKEIHHRVKNNLQIVHSLISLQSRHIQDSQTLNGLKDCQDRVKAMALVHEKLYRSKDLGRIDFGDYIRDLIESLFRSWGTSTDLIKTTLEVEPVFLNVDESVPCGLIVYEILSNCLKHAFPNRRPGRISVVLKREPDGQLLLGVHDDGVGLPAGIRFPQSSSLGLQLVSSLAGQLGGTVELERSAGTAFKIFFRAHDDARTKESVQ